MDETEVLTKAAALIQIQNSAQVGLQSPHLAGQLLEEIIRIATYSLNHSTR